MSTEPRVRIVSSGHAYDTQMYIDGTPVIDNVTALDIHVETDGLVTATVTFEHVALELDAHLDGTGHPTGTTP